MLREQRIPSSKDIRLGHPLIVILSKEHAGSRVRQFSVFEFLHVCPLFWRVFFSQIIVVQFLCQKCQFSSAPMLLKFWKLLQQSNNIEMCKCLQMVVRKWSNDEMILNLASKIKSDNISPFLPKSCQNCKIVYFASIFQKFVQMLCYLRNCQNGKIMYFASFFLPQKRSQMLSDLNSMI